MSTLSKPINNIGLTLRNIREEKAISLRRAAALINVDVAVLSKMERGERKFNQDHIKQLAHLYKANTEELMILFLSEKVLYEIGENNLALKALKLAEERVQYKTQINTARKKLIEIITTFLNKDGRISQAWIYGSFSRNENRPIGDIDLMIRLKKGIRFSLFDLADVAYKLELLVKHKIDLVEEGCLKPFAFATAKNDIKKIYG